MAPERCGQLHGQGPSTHLLRKEKKAFPIQQSSFKGKWNLHLDRVAAVTCIMITWMKKKLNRVISSHSEIHFLQDEVQGNYTGGESGSVPISNN